MNRIVICLLLVLCGCEMPVYTREVNSIRIRKYKDGLILLDTNTNMPKGYENDWKSVPKLITDAIAFDEDAAVDDTEAE